MRTATFSEFRRQAKNYFDMVEGGETVRILRHGKPVADMVPVVSEKRVASWKKKGLRLAVKGVSLSKAVLKERKAASR